MPKEIRATLRLRNNLLLSLREHAGLTQRKLAQLVGIPSVHIGWIENFGRQGTGAMGGQKQHRIHFDTLRPAIRKLAKFFQVDETEIASQYLHEALKIVELEKDIDHTEVVPLLESQLFLPIPAPDEVLQENEENNHMSEILALLTPRGEQIIRMAYGIDEEREYTDKEIAERFAVTPERIRSLRKKNERKIRELFVDDHRFMEAKKH